MSNLEMIWFFLYTNLHPYVLDCFLPFLAGTCTFVLVGIIFVLLDNHGPPDSVKKFKLERTNVPKALKDEAIKQTIFNLFVISPIFENVGYFLRRCRGCSMEPTVPDSFETFVKLSMAIVLGEVFYYYMHRTLHHPYLYEKIHKKNHEWPVANCLASTSCAPLEHALLNCSVLSIVPVFVRMHTVNTITFYMLSIFFTSMQMSGYEFPLLPSSEFRNYHFKNPAKNFGNLGIMDFIHETDAVQLRRLRKNNNN